jgi:FMN reductase
VVLPIATGGSSAHLLSIDYALKPVLSALGSNYILGGIYILDSQVHYTDDALLRLDTDIEDRLDFALQLLTHQLSQRDFAVAAK